MIINMYMNDIFRLKEEILSTTTDNNPYETTTSESFDDGNDMTRILTYAIPLSCVAIVMVLLIAIGIYRRHGIFEKWSSLSRMKNTDPRFYERSGLRRDSEYESSNGSFSNVAVINDTTQNQQEPKCNIATIA